MGAMGYGYGSECHLLRWMGRHRKLFDWAVCEVLRKVDGPVNWLDMGFDPNRPWADRELTGVEFLSDDGIKSAWRDWWPRTGNSQNWDAVGCWQSSAGSPLVLVEAKANLQEVKSTCKAKAHGGRPMIETSLKLTADRLNAHFTAAWTENYYQFANRLAVRHFLMEHGYDPHLLMIYFVGDASFPSRKAPWTPEGWVEPLRTQKKVMGLKDFPDNVHALLLHVCKPVAWTLKGDEVIQLGWKD